MLNRTLSRSNEAQLSGLLTALQSLRANPAITRAIGDLRAIQFHLTPRNNRAALVAILGGTGTGKSTIVNRLLDATDAPLTAASFRRTFTAGPIAITHRENSLPQNWLGFDQTDSPAPAQGQPDALTIVRSDHELLKQLSVIDTPDLDGDKPAHHAQADRVFRWADAVIFLVTPEKYQMTELLPYYRLAKRYEIPALFVMNKVEERAVVEDYSKLVEGAEVFAIARDDSAFQSASGIAALRNALPPLEGSQTKSNVTNRLADLLDRLRDQVIDPLRAQRRAIDFATSSLRAMDTTGAGVDVSPLMQHLRRRLQQRSVLYLMGPARVLDRVRQVPSLLARLPRTAWDWVRTGEVSMRNGDDVPADARNAPDFHALLADQMRIVQAKIQDVVAPSRVEGVKTALLDTEQAGAIADEELANLRDWLTKKWNATPRDTALLTKLIKHLPGGAKLAQWSEAAPYLLTIIVATHHAFFGPVDLMVIGGWSIATWLTEKLSNEVASRTRATNAAINRRFAQLAHQQIRDVCDWLEKQAPTTHKIDELQRLAEALSA